MGDRGKRVRLATNIYQDRYAVIVRAHVPGGKPKDVSYPLGTPLEQLRLAQRALTRELARTVQVVYKGSLAADIPRYLATIAHPRKRLDDAARLAHWANTPLAQKPRGAITSAEIKAQMATWATDGTLAIATINKCLTVLRSLYRELNEDRDPNPTTRVQKLFVESHPPRDLGREVAAAILGKMSESLTKHRLALMLDTGWPPAQIMRLRPEDIQWGPPVLVRLRPRRKGKRTGERWMPVTPAGAAALKAFAAAAAYGLFSTSSVYKSFQVAAKKVRADQRAENVKRARRGQRPLPVLAHARPYDLRHAFIAHVLRQSGNLAGTQYLAMHSKPGQTLVYGEAAIPELAQRAIEAVSGSHAGATNGTVPRRQKAPKSATSRMGVGRTKPPAKTRKSA